ncbi:hypothetical protein ACI65C_010553 [Semiaphis heraclei]
MDKHLAMVPFALSRKSVYYWLCCFLTVFSPAHTKECRSQLGMEFSKIPDHRITASSSYEVKSVGPQNARRFFLFGLRNIAANKITGARSRISETSCFLFFLPSSPPLPVSHHSWLRVINPLKVGRLVRNEKQSCRG